jgi:hypothetical protein
VYFGETLSPFGKGDKGGFEIPLNLPSGKGEVRSFLLPLFLFFFLLLGLLYVLSAFTAHFVPPTQLMIVPL